MGALIKQLADFFYPGDLGIDPSQWEQFHYVAFMLSISFVPLVAAGVALWKGYTRSNALLVADDIRKIRRPFRWGFVAVLIEMAVFGVFYVVSFIIGLPWQAWLRVVFDALPGLFIFAVISVLVYWLLFRGITRVAGRGLWRWMVRYRHTGIRTLL